MSGLLDFHDRPVSLFPAEDSKKWQLAAEDEFK